MAVARNLVVERGVVGLYHCISRCVRRAFLCGDGYDHRRDWIQERLRELARIFAVDVCGYAILSNHFHVVVRMNPDRAAEWSNDDVARRWLCLFGPSSERPNDGGLALADAVARLAASSGRIAVLRDRLSDLSWFMRCVNEPIARRANREDECTGRFWEGRFKCQALLDERAVLAAMTYVDLNPVRAGIAKNLTTSRAAGA
jgi:REP element-mobilizing transposase RayT